MVSNSPKDRVSLVISGLVFPLNQPLTSSGMILQVPTPCFVCVQGRFGPTKNIFLKGISEEPIGDPAGEQWKKTWLLRVYYIGDEKLPRYRDYNKP